MTKSIDKPVKDNGKVTPKPRKTTAKPTKKPKFQHLGNRFSID